MLHGEVCCCGSTQLRAARLHSAQLQPWAPKCHGHLLAALLPKITSHPSGLKVWGDQFSLVPFGNSCVCCRVGRG